MEEAGSEEEDHVGKLMWKFITVFAVVVLLVLVFVFSPERVVVQISPHEEISEPVRAPSAPTIVAPTPVETFPTVNVLPEAPIQGEAVRIILENVSNISLIKKIIFDDQPLRTFLYGGKPTAFIGFDLNHAPGVYVLSVEFTDGSALKKELTFGVREKHEEPLGIPEKLGGNTPESEQALVTTLASENAELANIQVEPNTLFTEPFVWPLETINVTDAYGYVRKTGEYSIAHKGTDFRAVIGTEVFSANSGIVRISKEFRNYGNTIVIDHGAGLMTFYMHLSKRLVGIGDTVERGGAIGLSGDTGYAEQPHLHFTVRVGNVSIDPIAFYKLF